MHMCLCARTYTPPSLLKNDQVYVSICLYVHERMHICVENAYNLYNIIYTS